ncbi:VirB4 family type IV secretion/conjugal transfer ATPase [Xanthomonas campestris]|uniref:VirB4 family type IV secretion/conjugal transfer ATPase n=1 Tax=Xanthomonas campestris TaxID=339 RepID=UPI0035560EC4
MKRSQAATNREVPVSRTIPYSSHISAEVVTTFAGDLVTVLKFAGIAYESADIEDLDGWHNQFNGLLKTIQSPNVTLWAHTVHQERSEYTEGEYAPGSFAAAVNDRYRRRVMSDTMMVNDLYVTIVYSPKSNGLQKFISRFERPKPAEARARLDDALEAIEEVTRTVQAGLRDYRPARLSWYEQDGNWFSEILEFFGYLLNGEWIQVPVPRLRPGQDTSIAEQLATSRPYFGGESFEVRGATHSRLGAIVALKEYPSASAPGFMNKLLGMPFEFVLTQSFRFIPRQAAMGLLARQQNKMVQSGDVAETQIMDISTALDQLASGEFCMGEHHLSLTIFGENQRALSDNIAEARTRMANGGAVAVREDWGLEAAFWSQLPANFRYRTRPAPITSLNFAGFASMHNYATGLASGNQWGPAVTLLKTASGAPYYFSFHLPPKKRKRGKDALLASDVKPDDRVPGNTLIIGPTGSGKTVWQTFFLCQLEKFKPTVFYYDKDRGMELAIRAMGGTYLTIQNGQATGFNPFKLDPTPGNVAFLQAFVRKLATAGNGHILSASDEADFDGAIKGVLGLPFEKRRLSRLFDFLDLTDANAGAARLERWRQSLSWVFDNEDDAIDPGKFRINGFDITDLLDNEQVREPVLMYLLHRQEEVIDGRRIVIGFDEGWKALYDPNVAAYIENKELTIRKQDGFVIFGTQNPSHVIRSKIADTLVQQSVTQIYLPNNKASESDYIDGFKLSRREFEIIKYDMPSMPGHYALIKQGTQSAIVELNLSGLDDELAVLSGTTATVELLHQILPETGPDPAAWLPVFHAKRRQY